MNLRPLLGNFTDPQFKLTMAEQWRLTMKAHHEHLPARHLWGVTLALGVLGLGSFWLVHPLLISLLTSWGVTGDAFSGMPWSWLISALLIIAGVWLFSAWAYRFIYIKPIRRVMQEAGYILCLECGYDQKGLTLGITQCPECGAPRPPAPNVATRTNPQESSP